MVGTTGEETTALGGTDRFGLVRSDGLHASDFHAIISCGWVLAGGPAPPAPNRRLRPGCDSSGLPPRAYPRGVAQSRSSLAPRSQTCTLASVMTSLPGAQVATARTLPPCAATTRAVGCPAMGGFPFNVHPFRCFLYLHGIAVGITFSIHNPPTPRKSSSQLPPRSSPRLTGCG